MRTLATRSGGAAPEAASGLLAPSRPQTARAAAAGTRAPVAFGDVDVAAPPEATEADVPAEVPEQTPPPAAPAACAITSTTTETAPDGTADTRTTVGVREEVAFTVGGTAADWTASAGTPATATAAQTFTWRAPTTAAAAVTIGATLGTPPTPCSLSMAVVVPATISMTKTADDTFAAGAQGVAMDCDVDIGPRSVCFEQVEWLEVPGPASNVRGYFKEKEDAGADLSHHPTTTWTQVSNTNQVTDHAGVFDWPPPWKRGGYDWVIPNQFRTVGETAGRQLTNVTQAHTIAADGTSTVSKAGASASRTP